MRVFARTARPIRDFQANAANPPGGVKALQPLLRRDMTVEGMPIALDIGATLLDDRDGVLTGSAPLLFRVIDPLGATRYELYRATRQGTCRVRLPMAATDPAGEWKVIVRDLLANTEDTATFAYQPLERCGMLAGATHRAVFFPPDFDRIHRFARIHRTATIVKGTSDFNNAAAERLARILEPWDVHVTIVPAAEVNRPRELKPEEVPTWVGIEFGRAEPGAKNPPSKVGFAIQGAAILLGTPQDNPLIAHVERMKVLPYAPKADEFPGRGRGYLAWQRDIIGLGQESVTVIAYDAVGMGEAVGSLYEAVAGIQPLTPWRMPTTHTVAAATTAPGLLPSLNTAWEVILPDRVDVMKAADNRVSVLTHDASLIVLAPDGKIASQRALSDAEQAHFDIELRVAPDPAAEAMAKKAAPADRIVKHVAGREGQIAVGYWGGTLQVLDGTGAPRSRQQMPQDICGLAWLGDRLLVGLADGRVVAIATK
jgi:hypothetical protein